jgi:hypothetical protein
VLLGLRECGPRVLARECFWPDRMIDAENHVGLDAERSQCLGAFGACSLFSLLTI